MNAFAEAAANFGAECVLTGAQHASGTDRIAEVVRAPRLCGARHHREPAGR